jgi:hypothetical protein
MYLAQQFNTKHAHKRSPRHRNRPTAARVGDDDMGVEGASSVLGVVEVGHLNAVGVGAEHMGRVENACSVLIVVEVGHLNAVCVRVEHTGRVENACSVCPGVEV